MATTRRTSSACCWPRNCRRISATGPPGACLTRSAEAPVFLFLAGSLALDFVNTAVVVRRRPRDLLATPADLAAWWQAAAQHYPGLVAGARLPATWNEADLIAARALRGHLRALLEAVAAGEPAAAT